MYSVSKASKWLGDILKVATSRVSRRIWEINIEDGRFTFLRYRANKNDCVSFARIRRNHLPSEKKKRCSGSIVKLVAKIEKYLACVCET